MAAQLFNSFSASGSPASSTVVDWAGGDGWIIVGGSFGGSAHLGNFGVSIDFYGTGFAPIAPITAAGTYEFSAPKGPLSCVVQMGPGDSVTGLTVTVVPLKD